MRKLLVASATTALLATGCATAQTPEQGGERVNTSTASAAANPSASAEQANASAKPEASAITQIPCFEQIGKTVLVAEGARGAVNDNVPEVVPALRKAFGKTAGANVIVIVAPNQPMAENSDNNHYYKRFGTNLAVELYGNTAVDPASGELSASGPIKEIVVTSPAEQSPNEADPTLVGVKLGRTGTGVCTPPLRTFEDGHPTVVNF